MKPSSTLSVPLRRLPGGSPAAPSLDGRQPRRRPAGRRRPGVGPAFALAAAMLLAVPAALEAGELAGQVEVVQRGQSVPGEASRAVVWFEPDRPASPRRAGQPFVMETRGKEFSPRVLVVPEGSQVVFPNSDPILHNVFSLSEPKRFDLGLYGRGPGKAVTFDEAGVVRVYCNVHSDMVAYVVVLDTPYYTRPDARGQFVLDGLPAGSGRLMVWHEQGELESTRVEIPSRGRADAVAIQVALTKPRVPPHLNKLGRRYGHTQRDRYRRPSRP